MVDRFLTLREPQKDLHAYYCAFKINEREELDLWPLLLLSILHRRPNRHFPFALPIYFVFSIRNEAATVPIEVKWPVAPYTTFKITLLYSRLSQNN